MSVVIPMYSPVKNLLFGSFPFWHDSAWGLLIGLENLEKIRLIGYEGGIPGVFYGPHWFWLIGLVQTFSKNPIVIATFTLFIPYFGVVPFLLWKNRRLFGESVTILLWLAFILTLRSNVLNLWQIHLTPVVFLAAIITIINLDREKTTFMEFVKVAFIGICSSLLINLNGIFGWVMFFAISIYLLSFHFIFVWQIDRKSVLHSLRIITIFFLGFLISHLPIIIFEARHNFIQTKAMIYVLKQSFLYNSAIVGRLGLTDWQIVKEFFLIPIVLLNLPKSSFEIFWTLAGLSLFIFSVKHVFKLGVQQKKLLSFLVFSSALLLLAYTNSKNPIWAYHFIGGEVIFLLLIGLLASRLHILYLLLGVWIVWVSFFTTSKNLLDKGIDPLMIDTLAAKKYVVESIYQDAGGRSFSAYAYSPSLYTFDYDYLFRWLGKERYGLEPRFGSDLVYLIIPSAKQAIKADFVNYKTPQKSYKGEVEWYFPSGVYVIKRSLRTVKEN